MELWDGYDREGSLAGVDLVRGEEIPDGLYHMVCGVLVRHIDGDYLLMQRDFLKESHPGRFEATAGGSALKGEDKLTCIKRELLEETGISTGEFTEIGYNVYDDDRCIFCSFLCVTDWDKENITLQEKETISFRWVSEMELVAFLRSDQAIPSQIERYQAYLMKQKLL